MNVIPDYIHQQSDQKQSQRVNHLRSFWRRCVKKTRQNPVSDLRGYSGADLHAEFRQNSRALLDPATAVSRAPLLFRVWGDQVARQEARGARPARSPPPDGSSALKPRPAPSGALLARVLLCLVSLRRRSQSAKSRLLRRAIARPCPPLPAV